MEYNPSRDLILAWLVGITIEACYSYTRPSPWVVAALLLLLLTTETTLNYELLCAVKEETQVSLRDATLENKRKIPATENFLVNQNCDEDDLSHKLLEQSSDDDDEMICNCSSFTVHQTFKLGPHN